MCIKCWGLEESLPLQGRRGLPVNSPAHSGRGGCIGPEYDGRHSTSRASSLLLVVECAMVDVAKRFKVVLGVFAPLHLGLYMVNFRLLWGSSATAWNRSTRISRT